MAQKVLVLGDSGTGKSASLRNFKPDEILVIRDGKIAERGVHADLVEAGGTYAELYETQFYRPDKDAIK
jgi:ABC-type bacteriocin/lantibiotic exporter with double-glycine peptidase domain